MAAQGLQAALPREMYVDDGALARPSATPCCSASGTASAGSTTSASRSPERVVAVDVAGESVLVTSDEDGALHAAYNVCRHRGSPALPARQQPAPATTPRPALPLPLLDLRPRRLACSRSPHADVDGPGGLRPAPGRRRDLAAVRVRAPDAGAGRAAVRAGGARGRDARATTASATWSPGRCCATTSRPTTRCCSRTTTSATTAGPCTPSCPGWCRRSPAAASDLDWDQGIPHREGAWTFTMTGTTDRAPLPGLDEHERTRHKGDLVYPNLMLSASADHVAAFVLHPRAVDRTEVTCSLLFAATRWPPRPSTRATPPSSGTWSTSRTGRSASRCSAACRRAPTRTAGSRRWRTTASTSAAGCCRGWSAAVTETVDTETFDYVVVGLGGLGSAAAWELARRGHSVRRPGAVRARPRPRRQPRHQPDPAAQLPHAGLRAAHAGGVRRLGATSSDESGERLVTTVGGLDLFPPDPAIVPDDYTASMDAVGIAYDVLDAAEVTRRWPAFRLPAGHAGAAPGRRGDRAGRPRHPGPAGAGPPARRRPARPLAGHRARRPRRGRRGRRDRRRHAALPGRGRHRGRLDQRRARPPRTCSVPLEVTWEQVTYFALARPADFGPGVLPLWIWMDDPSFYGFPTYALEPGRVRRSRPRRTAAGRRSTRTTRGERRHGPGDARRGSAGFMRTTLPGSGDAGAVACAASTRSPRTGTSCWLPCPATSASSSGSAPRTGSSSRRRSAGCSPTW